ncbi:enoyl-CoA hydratase/isomerase family protein [Castellaniella sp. GW247-6E4]|uniref:enoyl-CoA hydratase/isomerase family protein n=1 Tax=Castellaniella sp. GW247-6E4 TaxID=3140380 RepID=UPI003314AD47
MQADQNVLLERRGAVLWIILNRPEKRNAINQSVLDGVCEGYRLAHADAGVRAIVLTGAGERSFCAGADLQPGGAFVFDYARPNLDYADMLRAGLDATLPVIASINGVCMAGGMGLLCMADMAVACDDALFGLPEVKVGVFPMQVLSLLQQLVPSRLVREWSLSGEPFDARAALACGLINYAVPKEELAEKTQWLVERIVDKSPTAIRRGKYALRAMGSMSIDEALCYAEGQIGLLAMTEDAKEGITAFNEKRRPVWPGR